MTFFEKIQAIERLDQLIRLKATGPPQELANRIGVSRSTIYEIINCMKLLGAEIEYCRNRRSFYYACEVSLLIGFSKVNKVSHEIMGGMKKNDSHYFPFDFFGQNATIFESNHSIPRP